MIEPLLEAERALLHGMVDQAERIYRQALAVDPANSIAMVGLARVALERADDRAALRFARQALALDPDNVAARRLAVRMAEVLRFRGEAVDPGPEAAEPRSAASEPGPNATVPAPGGRGAAPAAGRSSAPGPARAASPSRGRGLLDRFRRRA